MDVHPSHHAPRNWREFLLQLAMITIGLFIALTLQAGVEALHHRHLVSEALENLQREMQINRKHYTENVQNLEKNRHQLARNIDVLRDLKSGKSIDKNDLGWGWDWNGYIDAAWKTARESGALSYMSFDLIYAYSEVYSQQDYINNEATAMFTEAPKSAAFLKIAQDPAALSPSDIQTMLIDLAESDIRIATLQGLMTPLGSMYQQLNKTP